LAHWLLDDGDPDIDFVRVERHGFDVDVRCDVALRWGRTSVRLRHALDAQRLVCRVRVQCARTRVDLHYPFLPVMPGGRVLFHVSTDRACNETFPTTSYTYQLQSFLDAIEARERPADDAVAALTRTRTLRRIAERMDA
jgi:hypothetical protein